MGNLTDHFAAGGDSNVLEIVSYNCDGRTVTLNGKTYTAGTASGQAMSTGEVTANGTSIDYTPPAGTKAVIYETDVTFRYIDTNSIMHFHLEIDGTEVTRSRRTTRGYNLMTVMPFRSVIEVGAATESLATGKVGTWDANKTLNLRVREYSSSYETEISDLTWWAGVSSATVAYMNVKITAIK